VHAESGEVAEVAQQRLQRYALGPEVHGVFDFESEQCLILSLSRIELYMRSGAGNSLGACWSRLIYMLVALLQMVTQHRLWRAIQI
jgi:hypothetical protein